MSFRYSIQYWACTYVYHTHGYAHGFALGHARGHVSAGHDIMHGLWSLVRIAFQAIVFIPPKNLNAPPPTQMELEPILMEQTNAFLVDKAKYTNLMIVFAGR